jgi:hypothetical protein
VRLDGVCKKVDRTNQNHLISRVEIHHFKNDQPDDQDYDEENIMIVVTIHDVSLKSWLYDFCVYFLMERNTYR